MPYDKLLKEKIKEKKLTYEEIARKCTEQGVSISATYLKDIANGIKKPPKEDKSRAIAKTLEIDERLLVLEGYIDKAPKEVLKLFNNLRESCIPPALAKIENSVTKEAFEVIKHDLSKMQLSEFLAELLEPLEFDFTNNKEFSVKMEGLNISIDVNNLKIYKVTDNSMSPLLEENDTVSLEIKDNYINGETIALKINGYNNIIYRTILHDKDNYVLMPLNKNYKTTSYNKSDIQILGKVVTVTRSL